MGQSEVLRKDNVASLPAEERGQTPWCVWEGCGEGEVHTR